MASYFYRIFNLKVDSEIEFSEFSQADFVDPEVRIQLGKNPAQIPGIKKKGILFETSSDDFLFRFPTIGSYRVQLGNVITIDPNPDATPSEISLILFGSIMGALFHQRGLLPIHGSAVVVNNEAISFIGQSSSGKSSLAAAFANDGFKILTDDICVLDTKGGREFYVQPGLPYLKLWQDILDYMNSSDNLNKVRPAINKYIKPLDFAFCTKPIQLKNIVCLETKNSPGFTAKKITGPEKFHLIKNQIYRPQYISDLDTSPVHFRQLTTLSKQITLFRLQRPDSPILVNELMKYIKNHILSV